MPSIIHSLVPETSQGNVLSGGCGQLNELLMQKVIVCFNLENCINSDNPVIVNELHFSEVVLEV